jgi:hypothetical protein
MDNESKWRHGAFRRSVAGSILAAVAIVFPPSFAQTPVLPEVQVTPAPIPDFEFDWGRNGVSCATCNFGTGNSRFAFSDSSGRLWVGYVDFQTGDFYPPDGHAVLLDALAAPPTDFGNGPEWVASTGDSELVYTKYLPDKPPSPENAGIARARMIDGAWIADFLPDGLLRASPAGSLDSSDPAPRIHYVASDKDGIYWRSILDPGVEVEMPISDITQGNARRWVPGTRKLIFQGQPRDSTQRLVDQIFFYDTDTGELEQATFDAVGKLGALAWRAPEFGNEIVFLTMPQFRQQILIYRKLKGLDGTARWSVIKTINTPPELPFVWSPEAFTHNGKSYVFFQLSSSPKFFDLGVPTHIAMSGINPLRQDFRMLTNDSTKPRVRLDPEYFITAQGPFIYYNRLVPETDDRPPVNDGVWRVDTGLGPPYSQIR